MFERFTHDARQVVVTAQAEARALGHDWIGTEHLLTGLTGGTGLGAGVLRDLGVDTGNVRRAIAAATRPESEGDEPDPAALETIGIDLAAVRRRVEETFGPGALDRTRGTPGRRGRRAGRHVPFTAEAKRLLERALRESLKLRHRHIGTEHVLLAVTANANTRAARVLGGLGVSPTMLRRRILATLLGQADSA